MARRPHEGFFGRPSNEAISSSRLSKPLLGAGPTGGGAGGCSLRGIGRAAGGSGATGGATASPPGRRSAASNRWAISARFWSAEAIDGGTGGGEGGVAGRTSRGGAFGASTGIGRAGRG